METEDDQAIVFDYKELNSQDKDILEKEALAAKAFFDSFEQEFLNENKDVFYVISTKWLNCWKKYVSYDELAANKEPNLKFLGQIRPEKMNIDILEESSDDLKYVDLDYYGNVYLKPKIQAEVDYTLITEQAWNFLKDIYDGVTIKRPLFDLPDGSRRVEVTLKQVIKYLNCLKSYYKF